MEPGTVGEKFSKTPASMPNPWGAVGPREALRQVAELCGQAWNLSIELGKGDSAFGGGRPDNEVTHGVLAVLGQLSEDGVIRVRILLLHAPTHVRVAAGAFFRHLAVLGDKIRLAPPLNGGAEAAELWVELNIQAVPLSVARESALLEELTNLQELTKLLQAELPLVPKSRERLRKLYKDLSEVLEPVYTWDAGVAGESLQEWAREVIDYLMASTCVALTAPDAITLDLALAECARVADEWGQSLGRLLLPGLNGQKLLELAHKAPGLVVVPAVRLTLGSNVYELANETTNILTCLAQQQRPVLFTGTRPELQAIFHGGQGGISDPLLPVVCPVPEYPLDLLTGFAVDRAGEQAGGLTPAARQGLVEEVLESLQGLAPAAGRRLLPLAASRAVRVWNIGRQGYPEAGLNFITQARSRTETFGGLSPRPRVRRLESVQARLTRELADPGLLAYFQEHLLAQDKALEELTARLRTEALTRPWHQPLRYCAQGTPGTGKSESAQLLAQRLGVPYTNIDCAGFPSYYTASAQLLGSGRGIVGSYQAGRLETVAKHHAGVVLEISDLDHAPAEVRQHLADLFLQMLETGEAQAASGAMFSCANLILVFTLNLTGGMDEQVYKGIGFTGEPDIREVQQRVSTELKQMLSSAFLSRIGRPILFRPLTGEALETIVEQAVTAALREAMARLGCVPLDLVLEPGLGRKLMYSLNTTITAIGARALQEHGRAAAAQAVQELSLAGISRLTGSVMQVSIDATGKMRIIHEKNSES